MGASLLVADLVSDSFGSESVGGSRSFTQFALAPVSRLHSIQTADSTVRCGLVLDQSWDYYGMSPSCELSLEGIQH